jgi:hypothetical protein
MGTYSRPTLEENFVSAESKIMVAIGLLVRVDERARQENWNRKNTSWPSLTWGLMGLPPLKPYIYVFKKNFQLVTFLCVEYFFMQNSCN